MNDNLVTNHKGKKTKKMKKKKNLMATSKARERLAAKEAEAEDLAESVDSGCIPDSRSDLVVDLTSPPQIEAALMKENSFISSLLKWLPLPPQSKELEVETNRGKKRRKDEKKQHVTGNRNKRQKVSVDHVESHADLDQLQDKYKKMLMDLRKNRKKNRDPATRKKEEKLTKKLKFLEKRKDKRTKNKKKIPENTIVIKKENNLQQSSPKNVKPKKPIYNQNGQLVFSKFDFSNSSVAGDLDTNMKSKDLKQILSQALKEKEKMKHLEKKGDKEGAASIAEQKAWSSALQKAEGKKVKNDVDLLKKSIKKQESRKKTSQKKWEQRKDTIQRNKLSKQNLRKKNIGSRKEAKLDKKMKKMKKNGHIVPGF